MRNKIVLITGCSSGFGYGAALKFAREGHVVYASMRKMDSEGGRSLQKITKDEHLDLHILEIDVDRDESVKKGVSVVLKEQDHVDILINNAGFGFLGPVEDFSIDELKQQYETNVFGMMRMVKEVAPVMKAQKSGLIINMSSVNGRVVFPLFAVYASTKHAIEALTEGLRIELAYFGVNVCMVEPGSFLTKFIKGVQLPKIVKEKRSTYEKLNESFFPKYFTADERASRIKFLAKLLDEEKVVNLLYKISQKKHPKLRYAIGIDTHLYFFAKDVLTQGVWEWCMHKVFKW